MTENNATNRVLLTGDTHGGYDIRKLSSKNFNYNDFDPPLNKYDYLIICGDFGLLWHPEGSELDKQDRYWLDWLDDKPWTTLFVDGNHCNFPRINSHQIMQWNGGKIHEIRESVYHLMRGQVFNLHGKKFFTMGGAKSHDIKYRIEGRSWWREEIPSQDEREEAIANLEKHNWKVDYVITHEAPANIASNLIRYSGDYSRVLDEYSEWLQTEIADKLDFKQWFHGHHHIDHEWEDGKYQSVYHDIVAI